MSFVRLTQTTPAAPGLADFFRALGQPTRIEILLAIGGGEACVCHLEAVLGQRQAYISQHLMALREAGLLEARRDGRFVYYHLADERLLPFLQNAAALFDVNRQDLGRWMSPAPNACGCPHCAPEAKPEGSQNHDG